MFTCQSFSSDVPPRSSRVPRICAKPVGWLTFLGMQYSVVNSVSIHPDDLFRSLFSLLNSTKDYSSIFNHYFHLVCRDCPPLSGVILCAQRCSQERVSCLTSFSTIPPHLLLCYHLLTLNAENSASMQQCWIQSQRQEFWLCRKE